MTSEESRGAERDLRAQRRAERKARRAERRATRKRRLILLCLAPVVLAGLLVAGRHIYHLAKERRADQFAAQGDELLKAEKWADAAAKYRAALQLDPLGYHGLEGAAHLATRLARPEAVELWVEVMKQPRATIADRQDYATLLVNLGRLKVAQPVIEDLLKNDPDTKTLNLASRFAQTQGDNPKAIEFARVAVERAPGDDLARFSLADLLADSGDASARAEARQILWGMAEKEGPFRQAAIQGLARAPELTGEEQKKVLQMLDSVEKPDLKSALFAADLRLQLHPEDAGRIYDQTIARWNESANPGLIDLARWLNLHLQGERVLSLYSLDHALEDNQLLLSRLDALANLQRWSEIEELLSRADITLDPSVLESFRARTAQERNATMDADLHWNHALSLAGNDAGKLRFVANFAEQSHANAVALKAYEQLARIPEQAVLAYRATQRLSVKGGDVAVQRAAAEKVASFAPNDPNAADQLAYVNLLAGKDVDANFEKAKALAEKYPDRLSYRVTAALGYLRQNDPGMALAQFKGPPIEWKKTPGSWRAVYAAVLLANEQTDDAKDIISSISVEKLNPDERALIKK